MHLVGGHDEAVAQWAGERLGVQFQAPYTAFGIVDGAGIIHGATVFNDFYPGGNIEMTHIGHGTLTRRVQRGLIRYAFVQCGATRLTAKTAYRNVMVRRLLPKAGFRYECTQKRYFGPERGDDALVYVLFRDDAAKWLEN